MQLARQELCCWPLIVLSIVAGCSAKLTAGRDSAPPEAGPADVELVEAAADAAADALAAADARPAGDAADAPPPATCDFDGESATVTVSTTSQLQDAVASASAASGPTVVWVEPGVYTCLKIEDRQLTRQAPLIIRKNPNATGEARFLPDGCYYTTRIINSAYVALDGLTIEGGGAGVWVERSQHLVLRQLTISGQGQEGIHVRDGSSHVDIIGNLVHDTGHAEPKWAECIYVGTGSDEDFPDHNENVWIEDNELHHCGNGEAINIKPEVFHATVRGNDIHHIQPGTPDQYNQSALTVEGSARSGGDYLPTQAREVWIEDNAIADVSFGQWASGIMVGGTGVYVVRNTVSRYEERGIFVNSFGDLGLPVYLHDNQVDQSGETDYYLGEGVDVRQTDPGPNPNTPQDWYCR